MADSRESSLDSEGLRHGESSATVATASSTASYATTIDVTAQGAALMRIVGRNSLSGLSIEPARSSTGIGGQEQAEQQPLRRTSARRAAANAAAASSTTLRRVGGDDGFVFGSEMATLMRSALRTRTPLTGSKRKRTGSTAQASSELEAAVIGASASGAQSSSSSSGGAEVASSDSSDKAVANHWQLSRKKVRTAESQAASDEHDEAVAEAESAELRAASTTSAAAAATVVTANRATISQPQSGSHSSRSVVGSEPADNSDSAGLGDGGPQPAEHEPHFTGSMTGGPLSSATATAATVAAAAAVAASIGSDSAGLAAATYDTDASVELDGVNVERQFVKRARVAFDLEEERTFKKYGREEVRPARMTKSRAKSQFALSDKDLATLHCDYAANPHGSGASMVLFHVTDLKDVCWDKYGSEEGLALKLQKNARAAAKRRATAAANRSSSRYRNGSYDDDGDYDQPDDDEWSAPDPDRQCARCWGTAALECINDMCCHCCRSADFCRICPRHSGRF